MYSFAKTADYGLLVARTEGRAKHKGTSFFMFPSASRVEVRPIHQITGESEFNEVFITTPVPHANLVGRKPGGWSVLQLALAYERRLTGDLAA